MSYVPTAGITLATHLIGAGGEPAFSNSWVSGTPNAPYFTKDPFGVVHLGGSLKSGSAATAAFTLPAGFRPVTANLNLPVLLNGGTMGWIFIGTGGAVSPQQTTQCFLDGVTFLTV